MTEEIKPTQRFGSVSQQWNTIGSKKPTPPELESDKDEQKNVSTEKRFNVQQVNERTTVRMRMSDGQVMKRQTVFMPQELAVRLKVHAAKVGDDISGIITRLVEEYLEQEER